MLYILLTATVIVLGLIVIRSHLRLRQLTQSVEAIVAGRDVKILLSRRWRLRFDMRTIFILLTVVAVVLGLIGTEHHRARQQLDAIESIQAESNAFIAADYQLGWLGDSDLAGFICTWVHSDLGCRARNLSIESREPRVHLTTHNAQKLCRLKSLEGLQIVGFDLSDQELASLQSMPQLRRLSLVDCSLSDEALRFIGACNSLEQLQLYNCGLTGKQLRLLPMLTSVTDLDLARNPIDDEGLAAIGKMTSLRSLDLDHTRITNEGLKKLERLENLESLSLCYTDITDAGVGNLAGLSGIHELALLKTKVTIGCRKALVQMKKLKRVWASHDDTTEPRAQLLQDELPGIKVLDGNIVPQDDLDWELDDNRP